MRRPTEADRSTSMLDSKLTGPGLVASVGLLGTLLAALAAPVVTAGIAGSVLAAAAAARTLVPTLRARQHTGADDTRRRVRVPVLDVCVRV